MVGPASRWPDRPGRAWAATGTAFHLLHDLGVPGLDAFGGRDGWAAGLWEVANHWASRTRAAGLDGSVVDATRAAVDRLVRSRSEAPAVVTETGLPSAVAEEVSVPVI